MDTGLLLRHREGPLLILTLNDPRRANPLSPAMAVALTAALDDAAMDDAVRAIVLTGAGKHFSAGADLAALEEVAEGGDPDANLEDSRRLERLFATLLGHPKLTVAAVSGAAIAGGCGLATACDLVIAEPASRFAYTEVKIGFIPALVSTFLTRRVPGHLARRLLLDPRPLDGKRAVEIGLADELAGEGAALDRARELALEICRAGSPAALAATKALLNDTVGMGWREALSRAAEANARQRLHPECRRGVRAFLETKSTPDWLEPADDG
ncbi:MAG TPA: enoyl-CoA hydratase/isomerase family protein [Acidobacteria bacterium]|nr:enoyl-CoA hydratase/isomerase family protein [Acidobacteriota bacterium]